MGCNYKYDLQQDIILLMLVDLCRSDFWSSFRKKKVKLNITGTA